MRNRIFLIGCVALALLTGCSSDDALDSGSDIVIPIIPSNSDVKIQLSSGSGSTRAALNPDENKNFEVDGLGIFCLANGFVINNRFDNILTWDPAHQYSGYYRLLDNVKAAAVKKTREDGSGTEYTDIEFYKSAESSEKEIKYYPLSNWLTYQFYGYYPRTEEISNTGSEVVAAIPITGKEDVVYGYTTNDAPDAYSAKYFREASHIGEAAEMAFKHKLIQVQFNCKAGMKGDVVDEKAKELIVKKVEVLNVPEKVNLVVASTDAARNGVLSIDGSATTADCVVLGDNDGEFVSVQVAEELQKLGQGIILPPLSADGTNGLPRQYEVKLTLAKKGESDTEETMLDVFPHAVLTVDSGKFTTPGMLYNVVLTIYSPEDIRLNATLESWIEDDTNYDYEY